MPSHRLSLFLLVHTLSIELRQVEPRHEGEAVYTAGGYPKAVLALGKGSTKRDFILLRDFIQKNTLGTFPSMISLR